MIRYAPDKEIEPVIFEINIDAERLSRLLSVILEESEPEEI